MSQPGGMASLQQRLHAAVQAKNWMAAAAVLREMLALQPGNAELLIQLSYMESGAGNYRAARQAIIDAAARPPRQAEAMGDLMARLRTFNEAQVLDGLIHRLGPIDRIPIPLLIQAGAQWSYLNEQARALRLLDEAKRGDPDYPPTLLARTQVLTYLGRVDDAQSDIDRVIRRAPQIAQAHWLRARLRKQTHDANHVSQIRQELQRPNRSPGDLSLLAFALHKELDDLGDVAGAWTALSDACRAKRATLPYGSDDSRRLVDALVQLPADKSAAPAPDALGSPPMPIFIVGMHRSGTSLLEQLLSGHEDVLATGELYDFTCAMRYGANHHCRGVIDQEIVARAGQVDFEEVGRRYLDGVAWRLNGQRLFSDKLPSNFLNIGFICRALPQAKILHLVRDPMETCFSNLRELFSDANAYSYDMAELADYFLQYRRLMAHWHERFPGRILDVRYDALTGDTDAAMREVAAFCGLDYRESMSDPDANRRAIATASAMQVRGGVVRRREPKWWPYREQLAPLAEALLAGGVSFEQPSAA